MTKKFILLFILSGICCCASAVKVTSLEFRNDAESKKKFLAQDVSIWHRGQFRIKDGEKGAVITISNARTRCAFWLQGKEDANGSWFPKIGMLLPSKANFDYYEFFKFANDKLRSAKCSVSISNVENGGFTLNFTQKDFKAEARFVMQEDDEKVYCTFKAPGQNTVSLLIYPSSFGGSYKEGLNLRKRFGVTPVRTLPFGKRVSLAGNEPWVFLADSYFDPAQNRGDGPCAVLWHPGKVKPEVSVGNYSCMVHLTGKEEFSFVLFSFHKQSNDAGLKLMKALPLEFK